MILNKAQILERLSSNPPMVDKLVDVNLQIQPEALDLTIKKIFRWDSAGCLDFDNSNRILSKKSEMELQKIDGFPKEVYYLPAGSYQVLLNEFFNIPLDVVSFTTSRSSLQRCGAAIIRGFFDSGFVGEGYSLLDVSNQHGLYLFENARVCQMEFQLIEPNEGYSGIYKKQGRGGGVM